MLLSLAIQARRKEYKIMAIVDVNALVVAQAVTENASKKAMVYSSDDGSQYVVTIDENIGEAMSFGDFTDASVTKAAPDGLKMRTVTFSDSTGKVKGTYPVGSAGTPIFQEGGTIKVARKGSATGVVCAVTGAQGEKRRLLSAQDTGQNSGDIT